MGFFFEITHHAWDRKIAYTQENSQILEVVSIPLFVKKKKKKNSKLFIKGCKNFIIVGKIKKGKSLKQ